MLSFFSWLFRLRVYFLSFSISQNHYGESWVLAVAAHSRGGARKKFRIFLTDLGWSPNYIESLAQKFTYKEGELSRININFHPFECAAPKKSDSKAEDERVEEIKQKAATFLKTQEICEPKIVFHIIENR